ncbi:MAG: 1-acylglycerol-3-phosphate O-acyltransferase [Piccolia ochrophora]|nr:MAG: 1-acylglycerol-3-phosphate O-acyltransferase [Piccolia ochrophora]
MSAATTYSLYFIGGYFALTLLLYALSRVIPALAFYARMLASTFAFTVASAYGVVASLILRLVGFGRSSQWATARCFKWAMTVTTGVGFEIQGQEHLQTRPAVFISNHQTELDVLMLGWVFPPYCSVTAKKSLIKIPIFGWYMALSHSVLIDRGNRKTAFAAFDGAANEMRQQRQSVFIFPEGTRSYYAKPDLLPFKKGAFHLAIQAKVPIVPVVTANYSNVLHFQTRTFNSGTIPVKVLPPIPTAHLQASDVDDLARNTRELMLKELRELTEVAREQGISRKEVDGTPMEGRTTRADEKKVR